jgi:hypothetical protein
MSRRHSMNWNETSVGNKPPGQRPLRSNSYRIDTYPRSGRSVTHQLIFRGPMVTPPEPLAKFKVRTVRALGMMPTALSARSLAGSFSLNTTLAALRLLGADGYVASGTSHRTGRTEPVYWLTETGRQLHRQLCGSVDRQEFTWL